jgi:hypothetical protein
MPQDWKDAYGVNGLSRAVRIGAVCVGIDKLRHMFEVGFYYFSITHDEKKEEKYAVGWGEWTEGVLSDTTKADPKLMRWLKQVASGKQKSKHPLVELDVPQGFFGLTKGGTHSNADLRANLGGLRFYQDPLKQPHLSFDIRRYVDRFWNEREAGNVYDPRLAAHLRETGKLGPADKEGCVISGRRRLVLVQPVVFREAAEDAHPTGKTWEARLKTTKELWGRLGSSWSSCRRAT